ncbi:hypothetical protein [Aquimarina sp. 2201CG14-23]|uniref:hypothetical protein n=1 Tax=Aquimarina mycalae TaxID=3040073 RepID=UPI002477DB5C|nr:hypothetical protein [Aquimarina sp. 2201CG14-23]MDH7444520.1 hypothetical protein [Aquimarina sp. 2201CG14-23]
MKRTFYLLALYSVIGYSQEIRQISFSQTNTVDPLQVKKSIEKANKELVDLQLTKLKQTNDSVKIKQARDFLLGELLNNMIEEMHSDVLTQAEKRNNSISFLKVQDSAIYTFRKKDSIVLSEKKISKNSFKNRLKWLIINSKEIKEDRKTIEGFDCYKVYIQQAEADSDMPLTFSFTILEMYVTEEIQSEVHPIIDNKDILSMYYPLEIKKVQQITKGVTDFYKLNNLEFIEE